MNAPERALDWTEANQQLLVAEFARLKQRLERGDERVARAAIDRARAALPRLAAIDHLEQRFGLSAFERDLLLLAAGVEMDAELAELCARASASRRPFASFGLALGLLPDPHWTALTPVRPLRRWRLLDVAEEGSLASARLRIDERVLHYLAGVNYLDPRLQALLVRVGEAVPMADTHRQIAAAIGRAIDRCEVPLPLVELAGKDAHGKQDVAAAVAARSGLSLHAINGDDIPTGAHEIDALAALWEREAVLFDAALLIECEAAPNPATQRFFERVHSLVFLAAAEPVAVHRAALRHRIDKPASAEQQRLWEQALGSGSPNLVSAVQGVCTQYRLSARDVLQAARDIAQTGVGDDSERSLWRACQRLGRNRLDGLAQRIESSVGWGNLVLPEPQHRLLRQIAAQVRHRLKVYEQWGFGERGARGLGMSALFAGESGTGKTMAAEALANELDLELFRIDLSAVVSKYIGETEKNLARVFDAAEDSGAILLFDEADALFGKRSEVKDSHDRYANIEVSYLLQRMEAYRGLAILTSNQKAALDPAFQRRLRFVVHFPFPDAAQREAIWRGIFPAATPTRGLDCTKLARMHVAGGNIRNIALNAAFFAAEADEPVSMAHLLQAAHAEASKRERALTEGETRGWV